MLIPADPVNAFVDYPDVPVANAATGPLAGLTLAVKDIFDVAGYKTGCGNPTRRAEAGPAARSAPVVEKLLDAGARFVGKTHTSELAFSLDGRNVHYGTPVNVAAPGRVPGGSSSGSAAAVTAGLVDIAIGSDTGGSVRAPGSFCGLLALRITHGRIDIGGAMPLAPSLDTVGWFARTPEIYERVAAVLLGDDTPGPPLTRMIVADDAWAMLTGDAEDAALRPALRRVADHVRPSGATVISADGLSAWQQIFRTIQGFEAWKAHGAWIASTNPELSGPIRGRFEVASRVTETQYREATARRAQIRARLAAILGADTVLVLPTVPTIAPLLTASDADLEDFRARALSMLCGAGLAGFPQISLPLAEVEDCPLGLSLIAPPGRDRSLIALARAIVGS
ncbi:MAG: amidase [Bauldia sp.]